MPLAKYMKHGGGNLLLHDFYFFFAFNTKKLTQYACKNNTCNDMHIISHMYVNIPVLLYV